MIAESSFDKVHGPFFFQLSAQQLNLNASAWCIDEEYVVASGYRQGYFTTHPIVDMHIHECVMEPNKRHNGFIKPNSSTCLHTRWSMCRHNVHVHFFCIVTDV